MNFKQSTIFLMLFMPYLYTMNYQPSVADTALTVIPSPQMVEDGDFYIVPKADLSLNKLIVNEGEKTNNLYMQLKSDLATNYDKRDEHNELKKRVNDLKTSIKTNATSIIKITSERNTEEIVQDLQEEYTTTGTKSNCDSKELYKLINYENGVAIKIDHETIRKKVVDQIDSASEQHDTQRCMQLRQLLYLTKSPLSKSLYDAYISGKLMELLASVDAESKELGKTLFAMIYQKEFIDLAMQYDLVW